MVDMRGIDTPEVGRWCQQSVRETMHAHPGHDQGQGQGQGQDQDQNRTPVQDQGQDLEDHITQGLVAAVIVTAREVLVTSPLCAQRLPLPVVLGEQPTTRPRLSQLLHLHLDRGGAPLKHPRTTLTILAPLKFMTRQPMMIGLMTLMTPTLSGKLGNERNRLSRI